VRWIAAFCAVLAFAGCGGGDDAEAEPGPSADPAAERLSEACTAYREAAFAELPPAAPADYPAYVRERRQLVDEFIAALKEEPESEGRARLVAAASEILSVVDELDGVGTGLYTRTGALDMYERGLDDAAEQAGVRCGSGEEPSAEIREFRSAADEVCAAAGPTAGLPRRDAPLIRERADGHADIPLPADAGDLERDTLAAERELAEVAASRPATRTIRDGDLRYLVLAARTTSGWSRQQVDECADLPLADG
jgi:hypothetical protein